MPAKILDGKAMAISIRSALTSRVSEMRSRGVSCGLAVVLVGDDPASSVYVRMKRKACAEAGIESFAHDLHHDASEEALLDLIAKLNSDGAVHGILVQLPLPSHMDQNRIITAVDSGKDVDGFHPLNAGLLSLGLPCLPPCTPAGVIELIKSAGSGIEGRRACVVGRSNIVGKPVAAMLIRENATVTVCHSRTEDIAGEIGRSDIVVAALGRPSFVKGSWIKPGAVVIDVGINRLPDGKLTGDVEFEEARRRASAITPVPGGVGPMTIAMLLKNTVEAAARRV